MRQCKHLVFITLLLSGMACEPESSQQVYFEVLYQSIQCSGIDSSARITQIKSQPVYDSFLLRLTRNIHEKHSIFLETPDIDFTKYMVLLVEMGKQSTAGYALESSELPARISNRRLDIELNWIEPVPGSITVQIITSPCLLLRFPAGIYDRIQAHDQHGQLRAWLSSDSNS